MFVAEITVEEFQGEKSLDVVFTYKDPSGLELEFVPEDPMEIISLTSIESSGEIEWSPCNGVFYISWDENSFCFTVARFGDGNGGELSITVPNTPSLMNSFREEMNRWREAVANI